MNVTCPPYTTTDTCRRVRSLVLQYGWNATAYQILNPGMLHWFSPDGEAVVGYVQVCGFRVVAGSPVCAPHQLAYVVAAFEAAARRQRQRVCYFGADEDLTTTLAARAPFDRFLLGAQPVWHPSQWHTSLARKASLRAQLNRARNKQVSVSRWSSERARNHPALRRCLHEWLATRSLPTLHFLIEPETLNQLQDRRVFVAEQPDRICGFLVASPIPLRNGWLVEQIVRGDEAPNGTTELLLDAAMGDLAAAGVTYVTLGLSPLSRRSGIIDPPAAAWLRWLLAWMRSHGERFYHFDGLDVFKAKFLPHYWEPVYAVTSEPALSLHTMLAITSAFSGTDPVPFLFHVLLRAFKHELRWLGQQMAHL